MYLGATESRICSRALMIIETSAVNRDAKCDNRIAIMVSLREQSV